MRRGRPYIGTAMIVATLACLAVGGSPSARANSGPASPNQEASPDATLRLKEGRITTELPYMWGRGRLSFRAARHNFSISGSPLSAERVPSLTATGKVFHLERLSDFEGKYVRVNEAGGPVIAEEGVAMRNEHGVVIRLRVDSTIANDGPAGGSVQIRLNE